MRFTHKQKILSIIKTELNKNKNKNNLILRKTYDIISKPMINIKSFINYKRFKINRYKNIYCNRGIYDEYFDKNTIWINEKFDFTKEDKINNRDFNEVIWKAVKGENAIVPAPKRAGFLKENKED